MDIQKIRHQHKFSLVEHALKITGHRKHFPAAGKFESEWAEYLLQGNDLSQMLIALKSSTPISADDISLPDPNNFDTSTSSVAVSQSSLRLQSGELSEVEIKIHNGSQAVWQSSLEIPIRLSYHWYYADGGLCEFDGERSLLSRPIFPSQTSTSIIKIKPPKEAGHYFLEVTLVWEGVFWFEDRGLLLNRIPVEVNRPKLPPNAQRVYQALIKEIKKIKEEMM